LGLAGAGHASFPIFLTAFADDELIRRAKVSEPFGYLVKPVTIKMLHTNAKKPS
jgi:hypothetical protein